jgi:GTPase SAR1 family protein
MKRTCIELLKTQGLTPVTPEQGEAVARRMNASYIECSSKEMRGVDEVFAMAVDTVVAAEEQDWMGTSQGNSTSSKFGGGGGGLRSGSKKVKKRTCKIL